MGASAKRVSSEGNLVPFVIDMAFQSLRTRHVRHVAVASSDSEEVPRAPWKDVVRPVGQFFKDVTNIMYDERAELTQTTVARLLSVGLLYPLDVLKTRVQVSALKSPIAIKQSVQGSWIKGITPALFAYLPHSAVAFSIFTVLQNRLSSRFTQWNSQVRTVVAACASDAIAAIWLSPIEVVKARTQLKTNLSVQSAARRGQLGIGFSGQLLRDVPFRALYLIAYDTLRTKAEKRVGRDLNDRESILVGVTVGATVAAVTTPLDVVRSRMMAQFPHSSLLYSKWLDCAFRTVRHEGVGALYRGVIPRSVYLGASAALFTITFDSVRKVIEKKGMFASASAKRKSAFSM